jgi:hypothetical protein
MNKEELTKAELDWFSECAELEGLTLEEWLERMNEI